MGVVSNCIGNTLLPTGSGTVGVAKLSIIGKPSVLPIVPRVMASTVEAGQADGVQVTWDREMMFTNAAVVSQFSVIVAGTPYTPTAIHFHPQDLRSMAIELPIVVVVGQVVSWSYTVGTHKIQEVASPNTEADNQTYGVTNRLHTPHVGSAFDTSYSTAFK